jgi:hypothetical protein
MTPLSSEAGADPLTEQTLYVCPEMSRRLHAALRRSDRDSSAGAGPRGPDSDAVAREGHAAPRREAGLALYTLRPITDA